MTVAGLALDQTPLTRTSPAVGGVFFGSDPMENLIRGPKGRYIPVPPEDRFWQRVVQGDGCWEWTGSHTGEGYSTISGEGRRTIYVHRYIYELLVAPIPAGLTIDHLCRNVGCVNPAHLEAVSMRENILRGTSPSAIAARLTLCPRGHAYTHRSPDGHRRCRTCERNRQREGSK